MSGRAHGSAAEDRAPLGDAERNGEAAARRVLVADLDGTLLGGDDEARLRLRRALRRHPEITVVFATGRGLASVRALLREDPHLPTPRWIVADVGASVVDASDMRHVTALEGPLRAGWPGHDRVRRALRRFPQLRYQEGVAQEGRCSYHLAPDGLTRALTGAVEALGCSCSYSEERYFDVLPPGAGKGQAVRRLLDRHGWRRTDLLVAGDSLNDLSLFRLGANGVIVGNAEAALSERAPHDPYTHRSSLDGAAAILSALRRLGWVRPAASVVIGYHRAPARLSGGRWTRPTSPNGILPTLTSLLAESPDAPDVESPDVESPDVDSPDGGRLDAVWAAAVPVAKPDVPAPSFPAGLPVAPLPVAPARWAGYFHRACKEALWPALMSRPDLIRHNAADWHDYEQVNAAFARHISDHAVHGATVWLHDYNLWLVPGLLKDARPDLVVGAFHHTPFPSPEVFRRLPAAEQLRASLARLDWAGFHTAGFARHFGRLLGDHARGPRVGVHPLGVDREAVAALARSRTPTAEEGTLVLSVERLDYAKAPVLKVHALAALLEQEPGLRGRLRFRLVCPPPEPGILAYEATRTELERAVSALNDRWRRRGWQPVEYIPRALPFNEVMDHYLAADVFWVTSLADGMNLTAQEYLVAQAATARTGVLVLSRYTGAARQFGKAALLTDPRRPHDLVDTLRRALAMPPAQRRLNTTRLARLLSAPPPAVWARDVVAAIRATAGNGRPDVVPGGRGGPRWAHDPTAATA
ncbi:trehalose-6-phosphate synthase [Streptomyces durbertensis]|uniref:Trehalose-6-phosphate synthase n=1 Tax=Streptomyces durbertensis TaxID=2448886 RepID=A0ABR6ELQ9_9ACTN|nr:trehalose-6-phosphate synthase [Streptomyces durbertensis]MBB1245459.1 trehalose-6-phosphate synthase [Streptomyces durbertensis]